MQSDFDNRFPGGFARVGIAGLGLIGASFARAIHRNTSCTVLGFDKDAQVLSRALDDRTIDGVLDARSAASVDLLLVALYPQAAIDFVQTHAQALCKSCIVMDCCGVKRAVSPALEQIAQGYGFLYVGGHPMAGRELSGYDASLDTLYQNASMIVSNAPDALMPRLTEFFYAVGFSRLQRTTPEEHDRIIAYTSQLAHVLSSAYVKSPTALTHTGFSAGSFQDMTRVAYLNPTMWTELFLDNADYLAEEIDGLCSRLNDYAQAIRNRNKEELFALLLQGRQRKEQVEGRLKK